MAVQAGCVALLMALTTGFGRETDHLGAALFLSIIVVAFLTAVVVNLWDWIARKTWRRSQPGGIDPVLSQPLDDRSARSAFRDRIPRR